MNVKKRQEIFNTLKTYIEAKSQYKPLISPKVLRQNKKFPLITFIEIDNTDNIKTTKYKLQEKVSNLYYEINIYATDIRENNKTISNVVITDELKELVDDVMGDYYGFDRTKCDPTPNLDSTIYRITMRYEGKLFENRNMII